MAEERKDIANMNEIADAMNEYRERVQAKAGVMPFTYNGRPIEDIEINSILFELMKAPAGEQKDLDEDLVAVYAINQENERVFMIVQRSNIEALLRR